MLASIDTCLEYLFYCLHTLLAIKIFPPTWCNKERSYAKVIATGAKTLVYIFPFSPPGLLSLPFLSSHVHQNKIMPSLSR